MSLNRRSSPAVRDARPGEESFDADEPQPGWWQASGGQWHAPVTGMNCGNGHLMYEDQAFCRDCRAPRAEFAIESASALDPAAIPAVADGAEPSTFLTTATVGRSSDVTRPRSAARKRPLSRLRKRTPSS
jgi:hypothetical protein